MNRVLVLTICMIAICLTACTDMRDDVLPTTEPTATEQVTLEDQTADELSLVDKFIESYNSVAENPITDTIEVDVTDRASGHYRTEFRLGAFSDSYAKTGKIWDESIIDIIEYGWKNEELRLYADGLTQEQAKEVISHALPIMDDSITDKDVNKVLDDIDDRKALNGYYCQHVGVLWSGDSLMLDN